LSVQSTSLAEVTTILRALDEAGCRYWLEGGWGVDALVGHQTRPHRDLDIDLDAAHEAQALTALHGLGYVIETDWRPNRVELAAPERGWVDLHPLQVEKDGSARQAALDGGFHTFPPSWFTVGRLAGLPVPCVTCEAQIAFRRGYELRPADHHDLMVLRKMRPGG
jgi:lincosamide nucleotidyltransferase A/C/D/E